MTDESLFAAAFALPPAARPAFLAARCPDPAVRKQVEDLLAAADASNPLDRPPPDLDRTNSRAATSSVASTAAVGDRVGPYKLLEKIGEGGMGEVWVADQLEPIKRRVALKLIKPGMDSRNVLGRFEAERQALAVMNHPNIAQVLDAGTTPDGRPYFVMELVKGTPITEFADARKLTPKQRLELFVPVCQAIQHAHMKGIIHRDIKPGNVLVALHDETPVPKVIDFGVAKAVGQQLTERTIYTGFGALVGTPTYMAPEQATFNQLDVDTRADVYALGVLLYELLAGSPPIEKERLKKAALDEVLRIVREEEPPRPSQRLSTADTRATIAATRGSEPAKLSALMKGELDWIVMRALEKDRTRRYDTANGLAKDVERYLSGEQVQAVPPSLGYRLRKAYRRNKAAVWVAAAFAGLITLAGLAAGYSAVRAEQARRGEAAERQRAQDGEAEANAQRKRAEAEQRRAEEEKRAAEAVRAFLQDDLLRQADVMQQADSLSRTGGDFEIKPNPTIRDLLDRAAAQLTPERIEAKFPGMPFVQAEVLHAVASAYGSVMEDERGRPLIDRAVALYRAVRGGDDPATLKARRTQLQLSLALPAERYDALLTSLIHDAARVFGPRDRMVLEGHLEQAARLIASSRVAEAIPALKKIRTELTELLGPTDILTLTCGAILASAYVQDRQFLAAVREMEGLRDTVKGMTIRFDHPLLEQGYVILAEIYRQKGDIKKTIEVYDEILDGWKQRGRPFDPNTWRTRHLLAWVYARNGNLPTGAELFEANIAAAPSSFNAYLSVDALREAEAKLGRDDKALTDRARQGLAAAIGNRGVGYKSWVTGHARIRLGQQLLRTKEYAEAETLLTAGLREMIDEHPHIREYSLNAIPEGQRALLDLYKATNRQAEGAKVLAEIGAALEKQSRSANASTWGGRQGLAWEVFNAGDHAAAAKLFEANVKATANPEDKSAAYHGLFLAEQKLGRLDAAREHARAAVDVLVAARGTDHRSYRLGMARSALGGLLYELKEPAAAEPHLLAGCREVADHPDQIPGYDYQHRAAAFDCLIRLLEESNRPAEAKKWAAVKAELLDKLMRKTLSGDKFTTGTVTLVSQLVLTHIDAGRHDDALALYREVSAKHTPADKPAADAWLRLSGTVLNGYEAKLQHDRMKPWAELRLPALEQDVHRARDRTPEVSGELLQAVNALAHAYAAAGKMEPLVALFEQTLARLKEKGCPADDRSVTLMTEITRAMRLAGRPDLARQMGAALHEGFTRRTDVPPAVMARVCFGLGYNLAVDKRPADGVPHLRESLRLYREVDPKGWQATKSKTWLGTALLWDKKYDEAEKTLLAAHAEAVDRLAKAPAWEKTYPQTTAGRLATLYEALEKPDEAAKWKALSEKK